MDALENAGLMDAKQAGKYLGKTTHWVQVNRKRGLIPYTVLSPRRFAYRKSDLDRWISENSVQGSAVPKSSYQRTIPRVLTFK